MYPTLGDLLGVELDVPTHDFFVGIGVLVALAVFAAQLRRSEEGQHDERLL